GTGAPKDVHPSQLVKAKATKINYTQRLPYPSKDLAGKPVECEILGKLLYPISKFVSDQLKRLLPEEYAILEEYASYLPFLVEPLCFPFLGLVLNFCVSTTAHKNTSDKLICVVIPFGDFQGGELCLYEPGLVFSLQPGEILFFPSHKITHFNLHFKGKRGSFVLSSDKAMGNFADNLNGWEDHVHRHRAP
ncbi:hypothetical protein BDN72DRAFT_778787, partial [Pluteus cervinus]